MQVKLNGLPETKRGGANQHLLLLLLPLSDHNQRSDSYVAISKGGSNRQHFVLYPNPCVPYLAATKTGHPVAHWGPLSLDPYTQ